MFFYRKNQSIYPLLIRCINQFFFRIMLLKKFSTKTIKMFNFFNFHNHKISFLSFLLKNRTEISSRFFLIISEKVWYWLLETKPSYPHLLFKLNPRLSFLFQGNMSADLTWNALRFYGKKKYLWKIYRLNS